MSSLTKVFRYGVVGILGSVAHMATLFLLVELHVAPPVVATTIGFLLALATSYWMNRFWTFGYSGSYWASSAKYGVVSLIGLGLNILIIKLCTDLLGLWYGWGAIAAVIVVALNNFALNSLWTFSQRSAPPAPERQ